jgi:hypothetical protein
MASHETLATNLAPKQGIIKRTNAVKKISNFKTCSLIPS